MQDLTLDLESAIAMQNPPGKPEEKPKPHKVDQSVKLPPALKEAIELVTECLELDKSEILRSAIMGGLPTLLDLAIKVVQLRSLMREERSQIEASKALTETQAKLKESIRVLGIELDIIDIQQVADDLGMDSDLLVGKLFGKRDQKQQKGVSEKCSTH